MTLNFPRYLHAKQTIDDRALNKDVLQALQTILENHPPATPLLITEIGAGIGTMLTRLLRWRILPAQVEYTLLDSMPENIAYAQTWLPQWAAEHGWQTTPNPDGSLTLQNPTQSLTCHFLHADLFDYIQQNPPQAHLLISHAVLDLLPMPASLQKIMRLLQPGGLAWLTINFDGVTTFQPEISLTDLQLPQAEIRMPAALDSHLETLYHQSMHTRPGGGDSQSGRHLFAHIAQSGAEILAAGASDWVVYPQKQGYPAEEAYFLHCILHFFEESLHQHPELDPRLLRAWLQKRRDQIEQNQLIYIAHQTDFLARRNFA